MGAWGGWALAPNIASMGRINAPTWVGRGTPPIVQSGLANFFLLGPVRHELSGRQGFVGLRRVCSRPQRVRHRPLFPTAQDRLLAAPNRGGHIAISAPGVEIFLPAPDDKYQMSSGTSL